MEQHNKPKHLVMGGIKSQTIITVLFGVMEILFFSIMSRILSQEDFGYFAIISAVTTVLTTITEAGMGSTLIQRKNPTPQFISTAFTLSFCLGLFSSIFLLFTAPLFSELLAGNNSLELAFRLMALPLLLSNVNSIARATMMRNLNFLKFGIFQIVAYVCSNSIAIYLALRGYSFYSIIASSVLNQILMTVLLYTLSSFIPRFRIYPSEVNNIISFGGWLTGAAIVRSVTEQLDKFILSRWMSVIELGAYNRPAGFISNITGKVYGIFDVVLYPILSGVQDKKEVMKRAYLTSISLTSLFSCVIMSIFILGSHVIVSVFFGNKWIHLVNIFQIISFSIIAISYSRIADVFFRSAGAVKDYFMNRCLSCVFTIICLYVGCHFGLLGVSIAFTIAKYIDVFIKVIILHRIIDVDRGRLYKDLLITCMFPIIIFLLCLPLLNLASGSGSIIAVLMYSLVMILLFLYKPNLFGHIFREYIYNQYINKYKCKFSKR